MYRPFNPARCFAEIMCVTCGIAGVVFSGYSFYLSVVCLVLTIINGMIADELRLKET